MKKDAGVFIEHVLECITLIEQYVGDKSASEFFGSVQLQDAVVRRIELR